MARLKDGSTVGNSEILTEGNLESLLGYLPLDPEDLTWGNVKNKPATFAPSAHSHSWTQVTGKPSTFTPSAHTHSWGEVTDKPTTFAPSTHSHAWSTITSKPSTFTPSTHTHGISDITGLRTELDSIPELTKANVGLGNVDNVKQASKTEHDQLASNFSTHQAENATLTKLGHVRHGTLTATLTTAWTGSEAPFTKVQTVTGIQSTDTPIIDVVMSGTFSTDEARQEAWGNIYRATTSNNSITFYAMEKPEVSLPIQIKVVH